MNPTLLGEIIPGLRPEICSKLIRFVRLLNKKWRFLAAIILFVFLLTIWFIINPHDISDKTFVIRKGETFITVGNNLADEDIINSRIFFWAYTLTSGRAKRIQAGEYYFDAPLALWQVIQVVSRGLFLSNEKTVVIPEGFTMEQIEERLKTNSILGTSQNLEINIKNLSQEFSFLANLPSGVTTLEGFLFPDTYRLTIGDNPDNIVKKFLANFNRKTILVQEEAGLGEKDFYEIIILASILEREVPPEDMPLAAGVLKKRIEAGVFLQADATLVYVLKRPIEREDITNLNSPYNTYKYVGLTPTPISNPGLAAIKAALNPAPNDYWYYLSRRTDGKTIFSRTLEEHNAAKLKYLR